MPIFAYFAGAGLVLVALLLLADATFEKDASSVIVTSQRSGLPHIPQLTDAIQVLTTVPAPEPAMASQAVRSAQPMTARKAPAKITRPARAARAEARSQDLPATPPSNRGQSDYATTQSFDRFSIKNQ